MKRIPRRKLWIEKRKEGTRKKERKVIGRRNKERKKERAIKEIR